MKIDKVRSGNRLDIALNGRLDALSAPKFEEEAASSLDGITELVIDIKEVEYLSSAGLRALLYLHQLMSEKGSLIIRNVTPIVNEIFELTGFNEIITIE